MFRVWASDDIPNGGDSQLLVDQATISIRDFKRLDPARKIQVFAYKVFLFDYVILWFSPNYTQLVQPVSAFHERSLIEIKEDLGPLNEAFFATNTLACIPGLSFLEPGDDKGRIIIVFGASCTC